MGRRSNKAYDLRKQAIYDQIDREHQRDIRRMHESAEELLSDPEPESDEEADDDEA